MTVTELHAPFPYFGGKRTIAETVWRAFGRPKQYIEPFCGSAAILLASPGPASLEVVGDANGFIANFWRATIAQPAEVARHADYPVSHVDLGARHRWLMEQRDRLREALQDPLWSGDARMAGWWLWGQCAWIGSGWCDWTRTDRVWEQMPHVSDAGMGIQAIGQIPHVSDAGMGIQAIGQIPHVSNAGMGIQAIGQIPHVSNAGRGIQAIGQIPHVGDAGMGEATAYEAWTSAGRTAMRWLRQLASRMERVRVVHGSWDRCLNSHYGGNETAVFLDPPYRAYEKTYGVSSPVADECAEWAREHQALRVILCGHRGDYDMPGWTTHEWARPRATFGGSTTKAKECLWVSPGCLPIEDRQLSMLGAG